MVAHPASSQSPSHHLSLAPSCLLACRPGFLPSFELPAAKFARCKLWTHQAMAAGQPQPDECREVYRLL